MSCTSRQTSDFRGIAATACLYVLMNHVRSEDERTVGSSSDARGPDSGTSRRANADNSAHDARGSASIELAAVSTTFFDAAVRGETAASASAASAAPAPPAVLPRFSQEEADNLFARFGTAAVVRAVAANLMSADYDIYQNASCYRMFCHTRLASCPAEAAACYREAVRCNNKRALEELGLLAPNSQRTLPTAWADAFRETLRCYSETWHLRNILHIYRAIFSDELLLNLRAREPRHIRGCKRSGGARAIFAPELSTSITRDFGPAMFPRQALAFSRAPQFPKPNKPKLFASSKTAVLARTGSIDWR